MGSLSSEKFSFSTEHKQTLKEAAITESGPGSILRDFNMLLEFLGERGFPVTTTHQLPIRALPEINTRLTHPLKQRLKRPQQKSYPHINGLYLLLRASGLTFVGGTSKKPLLFLDKEVVQIWHGLNPTEQYFTLLETWLLRGKPEIIGEHGRGFFILDNVQEWRDFFNRIPQKGRKIAGNKDAEDSLRYTPGWHHLGLLELFGLISVRSGLPVEGKAWNIEHIYRTPLGDTLLALLLSEFFQDLENIFELRNSKETSFGALQSTLQPYFPDWRNNLSAPKRVFREGVHIYKVSIGSVWYRIAIPGDFTLDALASAILDGVEFDDDHLYEFTYRNRSGALENVYHPDMEEGPWAGEVPVGDLPLRVEQTMTFLFDFGDMWEFQVTLEQIDPHMTVEKPVLLEIHGKPPEQYPSWDEDE